MLVQLAAHIFVLVALKLFLIHYCIIFDNNFKVFNNKKITSGDPGIINRTAGQPQLPSQTAARGIISCVMCCYHFSSVICCYRFSCVICCYRFSCVM